MSRLHVHEWFQVSKVLQVLNPGLPVTLRSPPRCHPSVKDGAVGGACNLQILYKTSLGARSHGLPRIEERWMRLRQ